MTGVVLTGCIDYCQGNFCRHRQARGKSWAARAALLGGGHCLTERRRRVAVVVATFQILARALCEKRKKFYTQNIFWEGLGRNKLGSLCFCNLVRRSNKKTTKNLTNLQYSPLLAQHFFSDKTSFLGAVKTQNL